MKRFSEILLSVVLSLMVVYLVGGVTIVRCMHSGMTSIVTITSPTDNDDCEDDCTKESSCLKIWVEKLNNATQSQSHSYSFNVDLPLIYVIKHVFADDQPRILANTRYAVERIHVPPKVYLSIIRVLII